MKRGEQEVIRAPILGMMNTPKYIPLHNEHPLPLEEEGAAQTYRCVNQLVLGYKSRNHHAGCNLGDIGMCHFGKPEHREERDQPEHDDVDGNGLP